MSEPPVIEARRVGKSLVFRCPWCRAEHWHGSGNGHRVAHCWNVASPLRRDGYVLVERDNPSKIQKYPPGLPFTRK